MLKKHQVFTPINYVYNLLDTVDYKHNLFGKKVLENSCGDGQVLSEIVTRYIKDSIDFGRDSKEIAQGLSENIFGFEIDLLQYKRCINNLNSILHKNGIPSINWKIYNEDFLRWIPTDNFDFIIGNPPYITYSELEENERLFLKQQFNSCSKGKFDYCYAFIERSINLLSDTGKMAYLIPSSIFKTVSGKRLRDIMIEYINGIIDFSKINVFDKALVKSSIIKFDKSDKSGLIIFDDSLTKNRIFINKKDLSDKWVLSKHNNIQEAYRRFGDYYTVTHSIATLCNEVFLLKDGSYSLKQNGDIVVNDIILEKELIRRAFSPRSVTYGKNELIIFPYEVINDKVCKISEDKMITNYPNIYCYLLNNKDNLLRRKRDKGSQWFEYGRNQAIKGIFTIKLLISTVVTNNVKVHELEKEDIAYSGMIVKSKGIDCYSLDYGKNILSSDNFLEYVKNIGIPINGNSYRITSQDIENYTF
ncbi:Eco57I restriction-modification methylase domain-containing protein [Streptococcus parasanguinis]|uniref:Eco57I restriction-modification methylase domain-containing protein n=1 Tax=Streptococcus parasanguinis TaxID=1318 RepID=UPI0031B6060C